MCTHGKHQAADPDCTCGIYAATDISVAASYTGVGNAFGLVYGWGEHVVPADEGFRAEYARIAAIFAVVREVSMRRRTCAASRSCTASRCWCRTRWTSLDYAVLLREGNGVAGSDIDAELRELTGQAPHPEEVMIMTKYPAGSASRCDTAGR